MNKTDIKEFVDLLFSLDYPKLIVSKQLEKYLIEQKGMSVWEAQEVIERFSSKVQGILELKIGSHKKEFTTPAYDFSSYDKDILIKSSLTNIYGGKEQVELKLVWRHKISKFLMSVTWRDFENIAKHILKANKINDIEITQATNDQGIDFWGYYLLEHGKDSTRFEKDLRFRIVGQVKHSTSQVKVKHDKVSSFGTELNRLRKKLPPNYFIGLPDDFFESHLPLVGLFITNSSYLSKAVDFSKDYGIIIWNGSQISEDLANDSFLNLIKNDEGELSYERLIETIMLGL